MHKELRPADQDYQKSGTCSTDLSDFRATHVVNIAVSNDNRQRRNLDFLHYKLSPPPLFLLAIVLHRKF